MQNVKRQAMTGLLLSAVLWGTACSNVHFSDAGSAKLEVSPDTSTPLHKDIFNFNDPSSMAKVDILIVDDNSASMLDLQQRMAARMGPFIDTLANVDWHVGITTTDITNGPFGLQGSFVNLSGASGSVLSRSTPAYQTVFTNSIVRQETIDCQSGVATCPSGDEHPIAAIAEAIAKRNMDNAGFFRNDASLAVIILSDEDESFAVDNGGPMPPQTVIDTVRQTFGPNKTFNVYGIITKPDDPACINSRALANNGLIHPGIFINELIQSTHGVSGSVCDMDYVSSLTSIGRSVNQNSATRTLSSLPVASSVAISVTPADPSLTYSVEGQQIRFNHMPSQGTRVVVSYRPAGH